MIFHCFSEVVWMQKLRFTLLETQRIKNPTFLMKLGVVLNVAGIIMMIIMKCLQSMNW